MGSQYQKSLPTIQQFRDSVDEFINAVEKTDIFRNGNSNESIVCYIDLDKRKKNNAVPWYAILPLNTYINSVQDRDLAERDKLLDGGVFAYNTQNNYEVVRVDGFLSPYQNAIEDYSFKNPDSFFFFAVPAFGPVYPGFFTEKDAEDNPFAIRIITNVLELNDWMKKFSGEGNLDYSVEESFKDNLEILQRDLQSDTIQSVFKNRFQVNLGNHIFRTLNVGN